MVDLSEYKVGVIVSVEDCGSCRGNKAKALKACAVRINPSDENETISVVTSASNVRAGSRIIVAPVGATIEVDGEEKPVTKATVGGVVSEGMFCDSSMLGWVGGAKGIAAQVPDSYEIGSAPPSSKPRKDQPPREAEEPSKVEGLFEKKLTKEEKKKLAQEKREARKKAKAAAAANEEKS